MVRQARRGRFIGLRILYSFILTIVLLIIVVPGLSSQGGIDVGGAIIAQRYFDLFFVVQVCAVSILTPAIVAGAIAEEKERKTLEFILATDLLDREIVLSKVGSRLAILGLFVLTGLPILSFLQFLGGVDPNLVAAGFIFTAFIAVGEAGVSILLSVTSEKARDAIIRT
jgi:ABC-type transport system involved in multi-copper enzyme maturation permease subunit